MDEKTEELRDIFIEAADEETVTETQQESRGSLTGDEQRTNERLESVITRMREEYEFDTDLSDEALRVLVRRFYAGDTDAELAEELGVAESEVFRARLDLHLLRESDTDAPVDLSVLRDAAGDGHSVEELADRLETDPATVERYLAVVEAEDEARRASRRYRSEFEDALPDADISDRHTTEVQQDGLEGATEGMETDVSF